MNAMTVADDIMMTLRQAGMIDDPGLAACSGWDYWVPAKALTDGKGIARTAHPPTANYAHINKDARAIIAPDMNARQLTGALWRQCMILPGDDEAFGEEDVFAVSALDAFCPSADHLIAVIGHEPRDVALYLDDLRERDDKLFRLVLAKDFRTAVERCPAIVHDEWPSRARRYWKEGQADYLPPFLATVLYAELARLAMNEAGLIGLTFDGDVELTTTQLLKRIAVTGTIHAAPAVSQALRHALYQSHALVPPALLNEADPAVKQAWVQTIASHIALDVGRGSAMDLAATPPERASALEAKFASHPQFLKEKGKGDGLVRKSHLAATFWGLNWRRNAAVRLLEIAITAREWNKQHRPDGPQMPTALNSNPTNPLWSALVAICFRWLAMHNPAAALQYIGKMWGKEKKERLGFDRLTVGDINPLTIDLHIGEFSGETLFRDARQRLKKLPRPGELGYTARSQAHLWLDDEGDDIAHFQRFQQDARIDHWAAQNGLLPSLLRRENLPGAGTVADFMYEKGLVAEYGIICHNMPPSMSQDIATARGAQLFSHRISPLATDPMLARLAR
jgi:hypothetical protein